jgi:hypothetical protein
LENRGKDGWRKRKERKGKRKKKRKQEKNSIAKFSIQVIIHK